MCAVADSKIGDLKVSVYMGYNGGEIVVAGERYQQKEYDKEIDIVNRNKIKELLMQHKKSEIVEMIMDLIDNSEEG